MTITQAPTGGPLADPATPGPTEAAFRRLRDWLADVIDAPVITGPMNNGPINNGPMDSSPMDSGSVIDGPASDVTLTGRTVDKAADAGPADSPAAIDSAAYDLRPGARLHMWPVALLSDQGSRGGHGTQPVRFRIRYAVAPVGPIEESLRLLDRILIAVSRQDAIALVVDPASGPVHPPAALPNLTIQTGLTSQTGLTIQLDLPVQIVAPAQPVVRVSGELRLTGSTLREITGRLIGPHDVPLAGMTVTAPATGAAAISGGRGEFRLPALPGGRAIVLHISGRGLQLQVEVPAETTDPVVIHCNIEEV